MKYSLEIIKTDVLVFDLDGTLLQTDRANNLAYYDAIEKVIKSPPPPSINRIKRITLKDLEKIALFSDLKLKEIKNLKDSSYFKYLEYTFLNHNLFDIVLQFYQKNQIILLTNASRNRAKLLLEYHRIEKYFSHTFYNEYGNKFLNCIEFLQLNAKDMLVFENEKLQVENALCAGITKDRIIQIGDDFSNEIQIKSKRRIC
ncbi:HAD family hydrolase [Helicobacter winghamensis]|uniref:HAD family hydrolase n=1 Tax=Helicobacter winghamensis TaxID=157268 RepID=A0A2N3PLH5_9HELI|nr:HAD hydrolase-like protein [Helicobacter winghamensis]PKT82701.1 hypothetical protein BCM31_05970 [Helicobacter winghamensis]